MVSAANNTARPLRKSTAPKRFVVSTVPLQRLGFAVPDHHTQQGVVKLPEHGGRIQVHSMCGMPQPWYLYELAGIVGRAVFHAVGMHLPVCLYGNLSRHGWSHIWRAQQQAVSGIVVPVDVHARYVRIHDPVMCSSLGLREQKV
jgi:hypothetical protein